MIELGLRAKFEVLSFLTGYFCAYGSASNQRNIETTIRGIERLVNLSDLQNMFTEVKQAMLSFRLLTEYLEQYPEAILKGVYNF